MRLRWSNSARRSEPAADAPTDTRVAPRLSLRISSLGVLTLAIFAVLLLRLWSLQVLQTRSYVALASGQTGKTLITPAPRGKIVDANGESLVVNRETQELQLDPTVLRDTVDRHAVIVRAATLLKLPARPLWERVEARLTQDPTTPVRLSRELSKSQRYELSENQTRYRGLTVVPSTARYYPESDLAAHLFGSVTPITERELQSPTYRTYRPGSQIGQAGLESYYDQRIRGSDGQQRVEVDAQGRPSGVVTTTRAAAPGSDLQLTLDVKTQRMGEAALRYGIDRGRTVGATAGAFVAMDLRGGIKAIASYPSFNPNYLSSPNAPGYDREYRRVTKDILKPLFDRALIGQYPPASTFKLFVALAAANSLKLSANELRPCVPTYTVKGVETRFDQPFNNWDPHVNEQMNLQTALTKSCDTWFNKIGDEIYHLGGSRGAPLQDTTSQFGFGKPTGVDIAGAGQGVLPDQAFKCTLPEYQRACRGAKIRGNAIWNPADEVNLSIGQGNMLATPLQLAVAVVPIANGGTVPTPHVVKAITTGSKVFNPPFPPQGRITFPQGILGAIRSGMRGVTSDPNGTAFRVFRQFPVAVAGKTGTAQKFGNANDTSLFVAYAPADKPEIVTVAVIENGGHGGYSAALASLDFLSRYFNVQRPDTSDVTDTSGDRSK